jgi:hypothetical protein
LAHRKLSQIGQHRLDDVLRAQFEDAYGSAAPNQIHALFAEEEARHVALEWLLSTISHQGTMYSAQDPAAEYRDAQDDMATL